MRLTYTFTLPFLLLAVCNGIWSKPKSPNTLLVDCPPPITLKEGAKYDTSITGVPRVTSNNGGPVSITYLEVYQKGDCKNHADLVIRIFTIRNSMGEEVRCNQNIVLKHLTANEIYFPSDTTLDYPDSITTLISKLLTIPKTLGSLKITYLDSRVSQNCNQPVRVRRQWSVEDICTGQIRSVTTFMSLHKYYNHFKQINHQSEAVCFDEGFIELVPVGEFKPYKYKWSSGDSLPIITNKFQGTYTLTITDRFGCSLSTVYNLPSISERADIGGRITTDFGIRVIPDSLIFENESQIGVACLAQQQNGIHYGFTLKTRKAGQYNYRFVKNSGVREGISTRDIVLIQRHILGIAKFKDTMQNIAADVNFNFNITASDIVEIRRLLLGIKNEFSVVKPWYFLRKDWRLYAKPNKPISDIEFKGVTVSNFPLTNIDIFVLKMGDVDLSYNGLHNQNLYSRSASDKVILEINSSELLGNENWIPVYLKSSTDLTGLQFKLIDKSNNALTLIRSQIDESYIHIKDNILTVSWSNGQALRWNPNQPLFYVNASNNSDLEVDPGFSSEWYDEDLNVFELKINSGTTIPKESGSSFFYPNPTLDKIYFKFDFELMDVQIHSLDGKLIVSKTIHNNEALTTGYLGAGLYIITCTPDGNTSKTDLLQIK